MFYLVAVVSAADLRIECSVIAVEAKSAINKVKRAKEKGLD